VTRKNAPLLLRSETIGILNDLRRAIAREKRRNPSLPDDIDAQIFGYLDDLEERRANRSSAAREKPEKPEPVQPTGETPTGETNGTGT